MDHPAGQRHEGSARSSSRYLLRSNLDDGRPEVEDGALRVMMAESRTPRTTRSARQTGSKHGRAVGTAGQSIETVELVGRGSAHSARHRTEPRTLQQHHQTEYVRRRKFGNEGYALLSFRRADVQAQRGESIRRKASPAEPLIKPETTDDDIGQPVSPPTNVRFRETSPDRDGGLEARPQHRVCPSVVRLAKRYGHAPSPRAMADPQGVEVSCRRGGFRHWHVPHIVGSHLTEVCYW